MRTRKLGPVLLTGFIIGPILGSGIIILPPLAYGLLGDWALPAWVAITLIGALFATVFGNLSILFPGDSGVSQCVALAFGPRAKILTSYFLMGAVCVGQWPWRSPLPGTWGLATSSPTSLWPWDWS